jgi:hypothetical protein
MAITLSKLGVPLAGGGDSSKNQGLLMPKLKYRYRVTFTNFGAGVGDSHELTKQVMTAGRPGVQFENIELAVYNSKINYAGRYTWAEVQIVLRDDMTNAVSRLVGQQIQKQFDFFEQSSASSGADYKFQTNIEILDGGNGAYEPVVLERFEMYGCYLQNTVYQQADYKSSEPMDITLTIKYDNAIQTNSPEPGGQAIGLGEAVGRAGFKLALGG